VHGDGVELGQAPVEGQPVEEVPVVSGERVEHLLVLGLELLSRLLLALVPAQHVLIMVAAHGQQAQLARATHDAGRVGALGDEIAHEHHALARLPAALLEEGVELVRAPVHVSDEQRPHHFVG
jgi:hypothetical protein